MTVTHGFAGRKNRIPEYGIWGCMIHRCYNSNHRKFHLYGGKGITVCDEWRWDFTAFLRDMGRRPSPMYTLGRRDGNGPYCPQNCRWETPSQQARNTTRTWHVTYEGETKCLVDWAEKIGIKPHTMYWRLTHGWTVAEAVTMPGKLGRKLHQPAPKGGALESKTGAEIVADPQL